MAHRFTVGDRVWLSEKYHTDGFNPKDRRGYVIRATGDECACVRFDCGMEEVVSTWRLKLLYKCWGVVEPRVDHEDYIRAVYGDGPAQAFR